MSYTERYLSWLNDPIIDEDSKQELLSIKENEKEIEDRFYKDLEFGTGGMRGILGAGTNRLNIYTIRKATQGLANFILSSEDYTPESGVAIAYDSRRMSPEFSLEAALVLNGNGIKTYVFESLRPTPLLSFAVRHLGCISGIVITASHNPPEYNGYKVYWSDGGQCTSPRDESIIAEVDKITSFGQIKRMEQGEAVAAGLYNVALTEVDSEFIKNVKSQCVRPEIIPQSDLKIVYTPLHGAGYKNVMQALSETGFKNVYHVKEQADPDGSFPTVSYPNPEDKKAYDLAIKLAKEIDADVAIATDPDSDRMGVAVKHNGDYELLTGNMTGVLLADYIISGLKERNTLPQNGIIISTIVSTNMTKSIAEILGLEYMEVLTGFKYIGEKMTEFEKTKAHTYLFGFEESFGYLAGTHARDKDAVVASLLICEAAAYYKSKGLTLLEALFNLYEKYGVFRESIESITLKGVDGLNDIKKIMTYLRTTPPKTLGGSVITEIRDYKSQITTDLTTNKTNSTGLPVSDVLYLNTNDGTWACVRPSGTEPKIKFYMGTNQTSIKEADAKLGAISKELNEITEKAVKT